MRAAVFRHPTLAVSAVRPMVEPEPAPQQAPLRVPRRLREPAQRQEQARVRLREQERLQALQPELQRGNRAAATSANKVIILKRVHILWPATRTLFTRPQVPFP